MSDFRRETPLNKLTDIIENEVWNAVAQSVTVGKSEEWATLATSNIVLALEEYLEALENRRIK